jgi:hypothetical protein
MAVTDRLIDIATRPVPLRTLLLRKLLIRWPIVSYETRLRVGAVQRPHYGWCTYYAAAEAKALGYKAMTVVEFGVAGGNGLMCLCRHRDEIEKQLGIEIVVVGFDSGMGLPASSDSRDLLYCWPPGSYVMDRNALEQRIGTRAQLVLGNVGSTLEGWQPDPQAPLGAVMFDLDYFSSTRCALAVLTKRNILPRVRCYFDDVCGGPLEATTERAGEREAIREFNLSPERRMMNDHISLAFSFKGKLPEPWHQQIYLYHRVSHPAYNTCITGEKRDELRLAV